MIVAPVSFATAEEGVPVIPPGPWEWPRRLSLGLGGSCALTSTGTVHFVMQIILVAFSPDSTRCPFIMTRKGDHYHGDVILPRRYHHFYELCDQTHEHSKVEVGVEPR